MKDVFTTGEAAKICRLSQQTIIRAFDKGILGGYKIPGSRFRRIPRNNLIMYMTTYGIPMDRLEETNKKKQCIEIVGEYMVSEIPPNDIKDIKLVAEEEAE